MTKNQRKVESYMITLSVLLVTIILATITGVCMILLGGAAFITVFGDFIVAGLIIGLIISAIIKHNKKKQKKEDL